MRFAAALLASLAVTASVPATAHPQLTASAEQREQRAILQVIARMEAAWNRGDFRGYMEGFANPDVIFVSKGRFQRGWQGTLDHYIRDYGEFLATVSASSEGAGAPAER